MSSPTASCASGTTASSPIATAPSTWPPVGPPSMPLLRRLPNPKPSRPSSLACSGPMSTAARTVVKDGGARSEPFRLSLGPPALRSSDAPPEPNGQEPGFYEVQDEPFRLSAPATSTDAATSLLAPAPPIDPSPLQDHTSGTAQLPDLQRDSEPWPTPRAHRNRLAPPPGALQSPRRIAFDPAVQFNRFYPPCCRTADKILFVRLHSGLRSGWQRSFGCESRNSQHMGKLSSAQLTNVEATMSHQEYMGIPRLIKQITDIREALLGLIRTSKVK